MKSVVKWDIPLIKRIVRKYLLVIVLFPCVIAVVGTISLALVTKPTYTSYVQMSQNDNNVAQISTYSQLVETARFQELLKNRILESKYKQESNDYSLELVSNSNSVFFKFQVSSPSPKLSQFVANQAMFVFTDNAGKYLSGANVTVVSKAKENQTPNTINFKKTAIGFLVTGLIVILVVTISHEIYGGKVKDSKFLTEVYGIKFLGELDLDKK